MLSVFLTVTVVITGIFIWIMSVKRKLVALDENIIDVMFQIGVQLSCRLDALMGLLELTGRYDKQESELLKEAVRASRSRITVNSIPEDLHYQEEMISETLDKIEEMKIRYPKLRRNEELATEMDAMETFESMLGTSCLIYNDIATKLNHEIHRFPVFLIAGLLGFKKRKYITK
ncbi:MAG TPA: LemA family protein [Lachnospiraceae bacterium]|nr:LemA family protein [Lachnospiraceae bacterium]